MIQVFWNAPVLSFSFQGTSLKKVFGNRDHNVQPCFNRAKLSVRRCSLKFMHGFFDEIRMISVFKSMYGVYIYIYIFLICVWRILKLMNQYPSYDWRSWIIGFSWFLGDHPQSQEIGENHAAVLPRHDGWIQRPPFNPSMPWSESISPTVMW